VAPQTNLSAGKRDTAESILNAAERLCAARGIEAVSIRDVAAEAGTSIPVIYHYYKSRTNLLRAVLVARFEEIGGKYDRLLTALEAQKAPAVRDILRAVLEPINQWRKPGREASLQFYALALVSPIPEVKDALDAGVAGFRREPFPWTEPEGPAHAGGGGWSTTAPRSSGAVTTWPRSKSCAKS